LPPQTRSEQARRFNDPDSGYDILVSSDAIGMGLNLNIRRIIFHTIFKSNGERIVRLDHSAVKQIAGRAGRRNSPFPDGEVTCRDPRDMEYLKQCMNSEIKPLRQAGLMPTAAHIELFHAALQAGIGDVQAPTQLHQLLPMFNEMAVVQGNYFLCRQNDMQLIAKILSKYDLPLSEKYTFCMAPIDSSAAIPMNTLRNFAQKRVECAEAGLPW
jgi:ATP-dependent RNA helicase SUPV3L1/SUV3